MTDQENNELTTKTISIKLALVWGGLIIGAAIGATTYLISLTNNSEVNALKTRLEANNPSATDAHLVTNSIITPKLQGAEGVADLSAKLAKLEQEKAKLVKELADVARDSLSPGSELGALLQQIESNDPATRQAAAQGLFELGDSRAVRPLTQYYFLHKNEADDVESLIEYLSFAWKNDRAIGIDFALKNMEEGERYESEWAYNQLRGAIFEYSSEKNSNSDEHKNLVTSLENVALRSKSALVRTRAKILLKEDSELKNQLQKYQAEEAKVVK